MKTKKLTIILLILSQTFIGCSNNSADKKQYEFNSDERTFNSEIIYIIFAINRIKINTFIQDTVVDKIIPQEHINQIDLAINMEKLYHIDK